MSQNYAPITDKDVFDVENSFYLSSEPYRIGKLLGQYELYKKIINLPGSIVECGVFKGVSLTRWMTFRYVLETSESRKVIGFDAFGDFPIEGLTRADDVSFASTHDDESGGPGISKEMLETCLSQKGFTNFELIKGDVANSLPEYFMTHDYERISLLHLDMDVYKPTKLALSLLIDRIVPGGLVVIDDYGTVSGATDAIDEFISEYAGREFTLERAPYYKIPAFITVT